MDLSASHPIQQPISTSRGPFCFPATYFSISMSPFTQWWPFLLFRQSFSSALHFGNFFYLFRHSFRQPLPLPPSVVRALATFPVRDPAIQLLKGRSVRFSGHRLLSSAPTRMIFVVPTPPVRTSNRHVTARPATFPASDFWWQAPHTEWRTKPNPFESFRDYFCLSGLIFHTLSVFPLFLHSHAGPLRSKQYRKAAMALFGRLPDAFSLALTFNHCRPSPNCQRPTCCPCAQPTQNTTTHNPT